MKSPVLSVGCNTSTLDAFQLMVEKNISGLAVTDDEDGTLVHNVRLVCIHARMYVSTHEREREGDERERERESSQLISPLYIRPLPVSVTSKCG
jgi:CBS domain-containing protein